MLAGWWARAVIHTSSPHSWWRWVMMLAVDGGSSHWRAIGSAFSRT